MRAIIESFGIKRKTRGAVESEVAATALNGVLIFFRYVRIDLSHELVRMCFFYPYPDA